jgi:hypothetical protein
LLNCGPPGLAKGERLLLAGLRVWGRLRVDGRTPHAVVRPALATVTSNRTAALFTTLMDCLEQRGVRPLALHTPGCLGYGVDEQRFVLACGVAPVDFDVALRLMRPMTDDPQAFVVLARAVNAALAADGLGLPVRLFDEPEGGTLH